MKKERDSFFSQYGVQSYNNNAMPYMYPNPNMNNMNNMNYNMDYSNDFDARISKIEREIQRLDTRITNIENKLLTNQTTTSTDYNFANSMYMV